MRGTGTKLSNTCFLEIYLCPARIMSSLLREKKKKAVFSVLYNSVKGSTENFLYASLVHFFDTWRLFPV